MRLTYSLCTLHCKESTSQNFSKTYPIFFAADADGFVQCESEAWILCGLPATGKLDNYHSIHMPKNSSHLCQHHTLCCVALYPIALDCCINLHEKICCTIFTTRSPLHDVKDISNVALRNPFHWQLTGKDHGVGYCWTSRGRVVQSIPGFTG